MSSVEQMPNRHLLITGQRKAGVEVQGDSRDLCSGCSLLYQVVVRSEGEATRPLWASVTLSVKQK